MYHVYMLLMEEWCKLKQLDLLLLFKEDNKVIF